MRVLVACEFSGVVRRAFQDKGHLTWSVDLLPSDDDSKWHLQTDIFDPEANIFNQEWDLMIAHPPCTYLARSGARWWKGKENEQAEALDFVYNLLNAPIPHIALENPIGKISTTIRKPDQIIQPWMFGHGETKSTCLWLKNLPPLVPTNIVEGRSNKIHWMSPSPNRWRERSRTYQGIAEAMAEQWGGGT